MLKALKARLLQKYRTQVFPDAPPRLPPHFRGRPEFSGPAVIAESLTASEVCPTGAFQHRAADGHDEIDLGRCIFCGKCSAVDSRVHFSSEYRMGTLKRSQLIADGSLYRPDTQLDAGIRKLYGKSLQIRQVSAGGCAACELDFNVLGTLAWDMGRFGIRLAASPRHADALLVTGPVSKNMLLALRKTYDAMPKPAMVIACGACAISGGLYASSPEVVGGVEKVLPVDLYVPGCPPHPATLLEALVRFIGRRQKDNAVN